MTVKEMMEDRMKSWTTPDYYGAFYRGKLLNVGRARVFAQKGRLKSELAKDMRYLFDQVNKTTIRQTPEEAMAFIDELIKEGTLEIKLLVNEKPTVDARVAEPCSLQHDEEDD